MLIKTKIIQEKCKLIAQAIDTTNPVIKIEAKNNKLYLCVRGNEYYVKITTDIDSDEVFDYVVEAKLFLNLVSNIDDEYFEIKQEQNNIKILTNNGKYKLPIVYENDNNIEINEIKLDNVTVNFTFPADALHSINKVNSKEIQKYKQAISNPIQRLYYITNTGCFTFTSGSCLNEFDLPKPVEFLAPEKLVKLFMLFNSDPEFELGYDVIKNYTEAKVILKTDSVYLGYIIDNDDSLLNKIKGPYLATKKYINENYLINAVISVDSLISTINRFCIFNDIEDSINIRVSKNNFIVIDCAENSEKIQIENSSKIQVDYDLRLKLKDIKFAIDNREGGYITLNCGNNRSVVINKGKIYNIIPERY